MKFILCAILALSASLSQAQDQDRPDGSVVAGLIYETYTIGRHAAVLDLEKTCWAAPRSKQEKWARVCVVEVLAGGIMEQAIAGKQHRGALPAFQPQAQRARIFSKMKGNGFSVADTERILAESAAEIPAILEGLMQAGMR